MGDLQTVLRPELEQRPAVLQPPHVTEHSVCNMCAVPLARALLHTPIPKWAGEEAKGGDEPADMQRFR